MTSNHGARSGPPKRSAISEGLWRLGWRSTRRPRDTPRRWRCVGAAVHSPGARCNSLNRLVPLRLLRWRRSWASEGLPSLALPKSGRGWGGTRRLPGRGRTIKPARPLPRAPPRPISGAGIRTQTAAPGRRSGAPSGRAAGRGGRWRLSGRPARSGRPPAQKTPGVSRPEARAAPGLAGSAATGNSAPLALRRRGGPLAGRSLQLA